MMFRYVFGPFQSLNRFFTQSHHLKGPLSFLVQIEKLGMCLQKDSAEICPLWDDLLKASRILHLFRISSCIELIFALYTPILNHLFVEVVGMEILLICKYTRRLWSCCPLQVNIGKLHHPFDRIWLLDYFYSEGITRLSLVPTVSVACSWSCFCSLWMIVFKLW